jgi:hypothetical protein
MLCCLVSSCLSCVYVLFVFMFAVFLSYVCMSAFRVLCRILAVCLSAVSEYRVVNSPSSLQSRSTSTSAIPVIAQAPTGIVSVCSCVSSSPSSPPPSRARCPPRSPPSTRPAIEKGVSSGSSISVKSVFQCYNISILSMRTPSSSVVRGSHHTISGHRQSWPS